MGSTEMGRYWSTEEGREVSTVRKEEGEQKEISKMRPTCKSHTDDKVTPGGKKKRKKAMGGGVMDMTRMRYLKGGQV